MKSFIYLFIYLSVSCNENSKNVSIKLSESKNNIDTILTIKNENINFDNPIFDTLLISQVRFNDHLFNRKYSDLIKKKIDSVVDALSIPNSSWECGNPFDWDEDFLKIIYAKNEEYLSNMKETHLYHAKFEGSNELYLKKRNQKLNKHTNIKDFKKIFKNIEIQEIENGYAVYNITFNPEQPEDSWLFYFDEQGYLKEFYLNWWLC